MQILGLYIEEGDKKILKSLKEQTWYGFCTDTNWHKIFDNTIPINVKKEIKKIQSNQLFIQQFYDVKGYQLSLSGIVGKNGSGKSTIFDLCNRVINNFAAYVKENLFKNYNTFYCLDFTHDCLAVELYYENNNKIYCIKIHNDEVEFKNNEQKNLFPEIKSLDDFSSHFFYTVSTSYSIYSDISPWMDNLYHKNDGYFTPLVFVPFKGKGLIDINKEKKLAEKRVETLSILLYGEGKDFIENYLPDRIEYNLRLFDEDYKINIKEKNNELKNIVKNNTNFNKLKKEIAHQWNIIFNTDKATYLNFPLRNYCKYYLQYKTLKICINYEIINKQFCEEDFHSNKKKILAKKIRKIVKELWDENNIHYMNLKILTCKRFIEYGYKNIYERGSSLLIDDFFKYQPTANTYDKVFINLLPDFYDTKFFYKSITKKNNDSEIQLSQMSSGEQQLYNSLSYVVYHIKNAESNGEGNFEGRIPYKFFNLVFDEAELYYHPEYQRCFINNLVKLLNRSNLRTKGINIIIATHSPFILSDIPTENIMALEEGFVSNRIGKTLGANIYDLLQNQFFMSSSIGECSRQTIEKIIKEYNTRQKISKKTLDFYYSFVENLGDEYLKTTLGYMLDEINGLTYEQKRIKYYKSKIKSLQNE